jgi:hypothetical protein
MRTYLLVASLLAVGGTVACSSSSDAVAPGVDSGAQEDGGAKDGGKQSGHDAGKDGKGGAGEQTLAAPPAAGPTNAPDGAGSVTMAISKLYLGGTDPDGTPDQTQGWTHFGYNIDGKSAGQLSQLCQPVDNAVPKTVHQQGVGGIENAFGHLVLPVIFGLSSNFEMDVNTGLAAGGPTNLLHMEKLGSDAEYNPVVSQVFLASTLGSAPDFSGAGTTQWPLDPSGLNDPASVAAGSKVSFNDSYVVGNTWVSGSKGTITIPLSFSAGGTASYLPLVVNQAVISMKLDAAHKTASGGIISGVLSTAQLTADMRVLAGGFDSTLCSGPTIESVITELSQASDIMADGTQDPTKACDGISFGVGFDGALVQLGSIAPATPPVANPCVDGGATGG